MAEFTVSVAEARANFSKLGAKINETGKPVTVFRNSKPWLVISPATSTYKESLFDEIEDFIDEYEDVFEALAK